MSGAPAFDEPPAPGVINFGVGQPSPDLLPVELLREASAEFLAGAEPLDLNYGAIEGDERFRASLAGFLSRAYGFAVEPAALFLSGGNSQALDFVCQRFARPGDTVLVEDPTYFLAFQVFRDHGLEPVGVPLDGRGLDLDRFEWALRRHRPRLVYTIPSYHNPSGELLGHERRERLASLSEEHGFIIVADEVYQLLHYRDPPPPPMAAWAERGRVLSLGSFSKILAPGLRLGWIQTSADLVKELRASGWVGSGGAINHFTSLVVRQAIESGRQERFIGHLREAYRERVETMDQALREQLGDYARWRVPEGGYFFWLKLAGEVAAAPLRARARAARTGFQPGELFSCAGHFRDCLRLSFAHYRPDEIRTGVERLAGVLRG